MSARLLRALAQPGRRLVARGEGWSVHARGDRRTRALAVAAAAEVRALAESGRIAPAPDGDGYVAAEEAHTFDAAARFVPPAGWRPQLAASRGAAHGAGFVGLARRAEAGQGPLSRRGALAGARLIADAEAAAADRALSMNWEGLPRDPSRTPGPAAPGGRSAGARARIARLKAAAPARSLAIAWAACVEGRSLVRLAAAFNLGSGGGAQALAEALETLADVYDRGRA